MSFPSPSPAPAPSTAPAVLSAEALYFDNAATSFPKPERVLEAMSSCFRREAGNPGRGDHALARRAADVISTARLRLARLVGAPHPDRIILTSGCTDALNMAIKGVLADKGGHVVTSVLEHNSVLRPLRGLEQSGRIALTLVACRPDGTIDPADVRSAMRSDTRLLALGHMSNVCGAVQDLAALGAVAREHNALFLVDSAQSAGTEEIDVERDGIDLLAMAGHKGLLGPTGVGALYVGPRCIPDLVGAPDSPFAPDFRPWREGGGGDSFSDAQPRSLPGYLEAGTPNVIGLAGLNAALDYLTPEVRSAKRTSLRTLSEQLWDGLAERPAIRTVAGRRGRSVLCLTLDEIHPHELGAVLDQRFGIAARAGLHCAPEFHRWAGTYPDGALRVSVGPFTSAAGVTALLEALDEILQLY